MRDKNITVTVSTEAYRQARIWAAQRDTSVSAVVEYLIQTLPGLPRAARASPPTPHATKMHAPTRSTLKKRRLVRNAG